MTDIFNGAGLTPGNPGNSGGKPGRSGRLPNAFKEALREAVSRDEVIEIVRRIAADENDPRWLDVLKYGTEHGYGKATQPISGPDDAPLVFTLNLGSTLAGDDG